MATVGCLGEIAFKVSDKTVQTLDNMVWSGSARYATHERHGTNALTEFTGIDPDTFTFDMELSVYLGVSPMDAIVLLWDYERTGRGVPLVVGDKCYGKYRWNVVKHKTKLTRTDGTGNVTWASVSVELQEYLRE